MIAYAQRVQYVDDANNRKRHKGIIPPIGGWLLIATFIPFYAFYFLFQSFSIDNLIVFFAVIGLFLLGLIDDKYPLNASKKFLGQFLISFSLVFLADIHFANHLSNYGILPILTKLITMVGIVFVINAYNLMDGINGLTALLGIIAFSFFAFLFYRANQWSYVWLAISIISALLVFLRFNLIETKVFLGDNGSMLIGLLAALFGIQFVNVYTGLDNIVFNKSNAQVGLALAPMIIPVVDTVRLFFIRPYYLSKSPFKADRNHVHHLLIRLGLTHMQASLVLFGLALLIVLAAYAAQDLGSLAVIFIGFFIVVAFLIALDFLVSARFRKNWNKKTMYHGLQQVSKSLNNPAFLEFTFAISFFILAMSIPFHRVSTSIPTLILLASFLILLVRNLILYKNKLSKVFQTKVLHFIKHPYSLLLFIFFLYQIVHILFIRPTGQWEKISVFSLLLIYWLTLYQLENIIAIQPRALLTAFIAGCLGFGVFIILQSFQQYPTLGWNAFYYHELLNNVKANPVTHSLYYNLAILFVGNNYTYLKKEQWRITYWILLLFFVLMTLLCASKVGYVVLLITLSFALYKMIVKKRIAFLSIAVFFLVAFGILFQLQVFTQDFVANNLSNRQYVWQLLFSEFQHFQFWGSGLGSTQEILNQIFIDLNYTKGIANKYNALNQFFETYFDTGIIGLISLLLFIAYSFFISIKKKNVLYFVYLIVVLVYMGFESLLQTQMGMVSFAFFNALFLAVLTKKSKI